MKTRVIVLTAVFLVAAIGVIVVVASRRQDPADRRIAELEEKEKKGVRIRLVERVELAKAKGKTEIKLPGMSVLHPTVRGPEELQQLLPNYTVVIAEPIKEKGYVGFEDLISSWDKFRILQTLSQAPPTVNYSAATPPDELLPVAENEFLVHRSGGIVTLDGVKVVAGSEHGESSFHKSQKYLLVLSLDPNTRIAQMAFGPQGILPLRADGELLVNKYQDNMLRRVLENYYGDSVDRLATSLRSSFL